MRKGKTYEVMKEGVIFIIRLYKHTASILLGPCCRFTPSCSSYALLSIQHYGIMRGTWLTLKRLSKCHPLHPGGYDPVPETTDKN